MKNLLLIVALFFSVSIQSQSTCEEFKDWVESKSYGQTYYSYGSDAISKVTFHTVRHK